MATYKIYNDYNTITLNNTVISSAHIMVDDSMANINHYT